MAKIAGPSKPAPERLDFTRPSPAAISAALIPAADPSQEN
jgi:hypothetical protein